MQAGGEPLDTTVNPNPTTCYMQAGGEPLDTTARCTAIYGVINRTGTGEVGWDAVRLHGWKMALGGMARAGYMRGSRPYTVAIRLRPDGHAFFGKVRLLLPISYFPLATSYLLHTTHSSLLTTY